MDVDPDGPGYKAEGTSREAAAGVAPRVATLRRRTLGVLQEGPRTVEEVCEVLGESRFSVQPRVSELRVMGLVEPAGARRPNASGKLAIVWRVVECNLPEDLRRAGQQALF